MCKRLTVLLLLSVWAAMSTPVQSSAEQGKGESAGKIHYVDATHSDGGNTKLANGAVFNPVLYASGGDYLWRLREFGNPSGEGTIYEAGGQYGDANNPENCPRLVTTVSGLPKSRYEVYVYFWSDTSFWRIRADLTGTEPQLPLFYSRLDRAVGEEKPPIGAPAATLAKADDFDAAPLLAEGGRELWQAYLGTTEPTMTISVYIDDDPEHKKHNYRTWYDGIGYKPTSGKPKVSPATGSTSKPQAVGPGTKSD